MHCQLDCLRQDGLISEYEFGADICWINCLNCIASILKSIMRNWLPSVAECQQLNPQFLAIRTRLYNDPYYRLQSSEEIAVAAALGIQIDVNQASVDDWLRLPGLNNVVG